MHLQLVKIASKMACTAPKINTISYDSNVIKPNNDGVALLDRENAELGEFQLAVALMLKRPRNDY